MHKELLKCCTDELVYRRSLHLPGDLCVDVIPVEHVFLDDLVANV